MSIKTGVEYSPYKTGANMKSYIILIQVFILIAVSLFAAGEDDLLREIETQRDFFAHHYLYLVNTKGYEPSNDHTRLLKIEYVEDTSIPDRLLYMMSFVNGEPSEWNSAEVQFLPWTKDSGIYLELKFASTSPAVFFTDALTGCYVVFMPKEGAPVGKVERNYIWRIVHLNFYNYEDMGIRVKTLQSYEGSYLLSPEDYRSEEGGAVKHVYTVVYGLRNSTNDDWDFYYQTRYDKNIKPRGKTLWVSGQIIPQQAINKNYPSCRSVRLTVTDRTETN